MNLVEARIGTTGKETVKLVTIKRINDDINKKGTRGSPTFTRRSRYGSSLLGAVRLPFLTWWALMSIPYIGSFEYYLLNTGYDELTILVVVPEYDWGC